MFNFPTITIQELILYGLMVNSPWIFFIVTIVFIVLVHEKKCNIIFLIGYISLTIFTICSTYELVLITQQMYLSKDIELFKYYILIVCSIIVLLVIYYFCNYEFVNRIKCKKYHLVYALVLSIVLLIVMVLFDGKKIKKEYNYYKNDNTINVYLKEKYQTIGKDFNVTYEGVFSKGYSDKIISYFPLKCKKEFVIRYKIKTNFLKDSFVIDIDRDTKKVSSDNFINVLCNDSLYGENYKKYINEKLDIKDEDASIVIGAIYDLKLENIKEGDTMPDCLYENTDALIEGLVVTKSFIYEEDNYDDQYRRMIMYQKKYMDKLGNIDDYYIKLANVIGEQEKAFADNQDVKRYKLRIYKFDVANESIRDYIFETYDTKISLDDINVNSVKSTSKKAYRNIIHRDTQFDENFYDEYKGSIPLTKETMMFYFTCIFEQKELIKDHLRFSSLFNVTLEDIIKRGIIEKVDSIDFDFEITNENIEKYWSEKYVPIKTSGKLDRKYKLYFKVNDLNELENIDIKPNGTINESSNDNSKVAKNANKGTFNQYNAKQYNIGNIIQFGKHYKTTSGEKESVDWVIIDKDYKNKKILAISKDVIDGCQFTNILGSVAYNKSYVRKFLNDEFYNKVFDNKEKSNIVCTHVKNEKGKSYEDIVDTEDNVFILSETEVNKYLVKSISKIGNPTEYAKSKGIYVSKDNESYGNAYWWLRSSASGSTINYVDDRGKVDNNGLGGSLIIGLRPCVWIKYE